MINKCIQKVREADVNVICLELGQISQQGDAPITGMSSASSIYFYHTLQVFYSRANACIGDPVFCSNDKCKAVFNSFRYVDNPTTLFLQFNSYST